MEWAAAPWGAIGGSTRTVAICKIKPVGCTIIYLYLGVRFVGFHRTALCEEGGTVGHHQSLESARTRTEGAVPDSVT